MNQKTHPYHILITMADVLSVKFSVCGGALRFPLRGHHHFFLISLLFIEEFLIQIHK